VVLTVTVLSRANTDVVEVAPEKARGQVPVVDANVRESDTVCVGLRWETPGHCADHVAYWFAADRALFAGST